MAHNQKGEDDIIGRERCTVMPRDALAQRKGTYIAVEGPTLGQVGEKIAIVVVPLDQPAVGQPPLIDILGAGIVPRHTKVAIGGLLGITKDKGSAASALRSSRAFCRRWLCGRCSAWCGARCGWYTSCQQTGARAQGGDMHKFTTGQLFCHDEVSPFDQRKWISEEELPTSQVNF